MKSGDVLVMSGDMKSQVVGTAGEVQVAHVADVGGVEVQQLVAEQRLVTTQLHLAHLRTNKQSNGSLRPHHSRPYNGEVQVAHVADVGCVEVQQLVTEQRLVTTQLHLAHL